MESDVRVSNAGGVFKNDGLEPLPDNAAPCVNFC